MSSSDQDDAAAVFEHTGIGFSDHLEPFHRARPVCYSRVRRVLKTHQREDPQSLQILIHANDIQHRVRELAAQIDRDHPEGVHLIAVLKGAFVFLSDLARAIGVPCSLDFMAVSSYGTSTKSSGQVQLLKDLETGLEGRDVVIVEDIVDTGLTLHYLQDVLRAREPKSLRTACLLSKPSRRKVDVAVEYIGFEIEDKFVVGYGLDNAGQFRHLPFIGVQD